MLFSFTLDTPWDCSLQAKDPDGTIAFVDILFHQLAELVFNISWNDLSVEKCRTIETLLLTVFDIYWQSEGKVKDAVAELIGDKYIKCFVDLDGVLISISEYAIQFLKHNIFVSLLILNTCVSATVRNYTTHI